MAAIPRAVAGGALAVLGGAALLVSIFVLPWYGVGEGKIAPIQIQGPAPALHAQLEPGDPPTLPGEPPPLPGEPPPLPGEPPPLPGDPQGPLSGAPGLVDPDDLPGGEVPDDLGAWTGQGVLGTIANVVAVLAALAAFAAAGAVFARRLPRSTGLGLAALGAAAVVAVALRMIFTPEEVNDFEFDATLEVGVFVALAGALAITVAGGLLWRLEIARR